MASLLLTSPTPAQFHRVLFTQSLSSGHVSFSSRPVTTTTSSPLPLPRGDKKAAKGKRFNHSFGIARRRVRIMEGGPPRVAVPGAAVPKKDPFEDTEIIKHAFDDDSLLP